MNRTVGSSFRRDRTDVLEDWYDKWGYTSFSNCQARKKEKKKQIKNDIQVEIIWITRQYLFFLPC